MMMNGSLPGEAKGSIARGDDFVSWTAGAALQSEFPAFIEWLINHAEQIVFIVCFMLAILFKVLHRVSLGQGLVLNDYLLLC